MARAAPDDFWLSSGHLLLDRDSRGRLTVTDEFLKLYLARPEMVPPPAACAAERALHTSMLAAPRTRIDAGELARLADPDARDNWQTVLAFRDHLLAHPTIEAAYLALMRDGVGRTPPLFVAQLVHVIMRNVLDGESDPYLLRAAELFWRPQRLTREGGGILLADEEVVDGVRDDVANGAAVDRHASPLIAMLGEAKVGNLDVLSEANKAAYLGRSDAYDMVLDFRTDGPGRAALAQVIERWLGHMLGVTARVSPLTAVADDDWFWFVGLDAEATRIGNALWQGEALDDATRDRIVALYDMRVDGAPKVADRAIYLILGLTRDRIVRFKPQNLLLGLPSGVVAGNDGAAIG